jgi:hypothetical protein
MQEGGSVVPADADAGLDRIKRLQEQLQKAPRRSTGRRALAKVVRIEAGLYRKSLDIRQAAETRTKKLERAITRVI